jgi:formate dehydrogenase subunit beta
MNVNRLLYIRDGNVVKTLQDFLASWWRQAGLDAMLAPVELPGRFGAVSQIIESPADLSTVNPFAPVMRSNAASAVDEFLGEHPAGRFVVMLRPCELRTLVELRKRHPTRSRSSALSKGDLDLVIIGVDCLGTFPEIEYARLVSLHGADAIAREAIAYDIGDGSLPGTLRVACQVCDSSAPPCGDIVIGFVGIALQGALLVIARDESTDKRLGLQKATDSLAEKQQVEYRQTVVKAVADKRAARRASLFHSSTQPDGDFCNLLACFARCTLCADCLDACPLYEGELTSMLGVGNLHVPVRPLMSELVGVSRWLASCSGCGMCQEACEYGISLAPMISMLSHRIRQGLHYTAGDPAQRLPWEKD